MKIFATKKAIQELVSEILENPPGLGWQATGDLSTSPVSVSAVVDPSAAVTDPGNEKFKPTDRHELKAALNMLASQVPDDKVSDFYSLMQSEVQDYENDEEDMAKNDKVEESIRRAVRAMIKESKKASHKSLKEFWAYKLHEADPGLKKKKSFNPFASRAAQEKAAERVKNLPAPTNPEGVAPTRYAPAASGKASMQPPTPEALQQLRDLLEKLDVTGKDQENLIRLRSERRASSALAEAIERISDDDARKFGSIFNQTKNYLLILSEGSEDKDDSALWQEILRFTGLKEKLKGQGLNDKQLDAKVSALDKKLSQDAAEFDQKGDSYVTSSDLFDLAFDNKFKESFSDYCLAKGNEIRKILASSAEEDEKRGYMTSAEETLSDTAAALGPDPKTGKIWSSSQVQKISYIVLGKFCLGIKCLAIDLNLDVEEDPKALAAALDPDHEASEEDEETISSISASDLEAEQPSVSSIDRDEALDGMVNSFYGDNVVDDFKKSLNDYIMSVFPTKTTSTKKGIYPSGSEFISSTAYGVEFGDRGLSSLIEELEKLADPNQPELSLAKEDVEEAVDKKIESAMNRYMSGG